MIEKTYLIKFSSEEVKSRFERLLAMLHRAASGHSGTFAMPLDGDGSERIIVDGLDKTIMYEAELIAGVGYDVEMANSKSYSGLFIDKNRQRRWYTGPAANLYNDGDIVKTVPSRDWNHPKNK